MEITDSEKTAQATIEKWMADGDTKEEAIDRWQQITYTRLPEIIKNLIKESQDAMRMVSWECSNKC